MRDLRDLSPADENDLCKPLMPVPMNRLLELDLLRALVAVNETGSFTRAADVLNRTQAAVSMQIRRLEEACGVVLVSRAKREFRLTDEGEALAAHARRMLLLNDEAIANLAPDHVAGTVRMAVPDMYAIHVLPPILADFSDAYPNVQIQLQSGVSQTDVVQTLGGVNLDLMIAVEPAGTTSGLVLSRERAIWATSATRTPHLKTPLPLALLREGTLLRFWALSNLGQRGRDWREAYVSASSLALLAAIEAGLAVGVIRESSLSPGMRELTEAEGFKALPSFDVTLLHANAGLGRAARALREFVIARLLPAGSIQPPA
jgi:DNA-binding transcriptional LysR family regulator